MTPRTPVSIEIKISAQVVEKLRHYCATHDISEHDVVEHVLEEWYATANVS